MSPTVALVAVGAHGDTAVGSRIGAFARGLTRRGWQVTVIDPPLPPTTVAQRLLRHTPTALRSMLQDAGVEGDVQPLTGWRLRQALRGEAAEIVVVSVPPFSLLGIAAIAVNPQLPLVVDYRDPWSARLNPPTLARVTRTIERRAVRRASAATYAGGPAFGELLVRYLRLSPEQVISVPNGFDTADTDGLSGAQVRPERNGEPLRLVMNGYWYGCNGPGMESRIPAKIYDYLATGVPVITLCPPSAALLQIPETRRFHHIHYCNLNGLVTLLRQAMRDRATLRTGRLGEGPTREPGIETLHATLRRLLPVL